MDEYKRKIEGFRALVAYSCMAVLVMVAVLGPCRCRFTHSSISAHERSARLMTEGQIECRNASFSAGMGRAYAILIREMERLLERYSTQRFFVLQGSREPDT